LPDVADRGELTCNGEQEADTRTAAPELLLAWPVRRVYILGTIVKWRLHRLGRTVHHQEGARRCCVSRAEAATVRLAAWSDGLRELGECRCEAVARFGVEAEFIVVAAAVVDECVPGADRLDGTQPFERQRTHYVAQRAWLPAHGVRVVAAPPASP